MSDTDEAGPDAPIPTDGPWGIKWISGHARHEGIKAAKRARMNVGDYVAAAMLEKIAREREVQPGLDVLGPGDVRTIDGSGGPPNIEDFVRAVDIAERLALMRGQRLSNQLTQRLVTRLSDLIGVDPGKRSFQRPRPAPELKHQTPDAEP